MKKHEGTGRLDDFFMIIKNKETPQITGGTNSNEAVEMHTMIKFK